MIWKGQLHKLRIRARAVRHRFSYELRAKPSVQYDPMHNISQENTPVKYYAGSDCTAPLGALSVAPRAKNSYGSVSVKGSKLTLYKGGICMRPLFYCQAPTVRDSSVPQNAGPTAQGKDEQQSNEP